MRFPVFAAAAAALLATSLAAQTLAAPQMKALADSTATLTAAAAKATPGLHAQLVAHHDLMLAALRSDAASARANALDATTRAALVAADPTADALLERNAALTGELVTTIGDGLDGTATTLYTLHSRTADIELSFATPGALKNAAHLAQSHLPVTVAGLALDTYLGADTLAPAAPADCTPTATADSFHPHSTVGNCTTTGPQSIAIIIVKFAGNTAAYPTGLDQVSYWQTQLTGANPSVNGLWNEISYGQTTAVGAVYGPITVPGSYDCTTTSAMQTAVLAAAASTVDYTQYSRIMIVFPVSTCTFGGLGYVGCVSATTTVTHPYSIVWMPVTPGYTTTSPKLWTSMSHELGHNLGLNHSNTLDFGAISLGPLDFYAANPGTVNGSNSATGLPTNLSAVNTEYGDHFAMMGYSWPPAGAYALHQRADILQWLAATDELQVTSSGTYTLVPTEATSGIRGLHILRDASTHTFISAEFHQPQGYYTPSNLAAMPSNNTLVTGAHIFYDDGREDALHTYMLDMTPTAVSNNFYDGNLAPGKTWSDPYSLLTLTVGTQTSTALPLTVSYDTPCATLALSGNQFPATGGTGTLTITAPSTCAWTASTNATWISFTGTLSGTGNGSVAFTVAANTAQDPRDTFLTAQRQNLHLTQTGTVAAILSFAPNTGTSAAGAQQTFTYSYSDALGLSDITQSNLTFAGSATSGCSVAILYSGSNAFIYLYNSSTNSYTSGITINSAGTGTSTASVSGCTFYAAGSKYIVSGNTATFTLNLSFSTAAAGQHGVQAYLYSSTDSTGSEVGTWYVAAPATVAISPATAAQATTSLVTFSGTGTIFNAGSTLTISGTGVTSSTVTYASATSLTANLSVAANATLGAHTVTISSGFETDTATYTVTAATTASATSTQLTLPTAPFFAGNAILLTANVASSSGTPTGSVNFYDGTTLLGSGTLTNGVATYSASLATGSHSLTASYVATTSFAASTSLISTAAVLDFALSPTAGTMTVTAGNTGSATLTITPATGGFAQAISFTCTGAPAASTCLFTSASANPGNATATVTVTLTTTARPSIARPTAKQGGLGLGSFAWLVLVPLALLLTRRRKLATISLALLLTALTLTTGCGSGSNAASTPKTGGTPAGAATLTITATATGAGTQSLTHTAAVNVTVN